MTESQINPKELLLKAQRFAKADNAPMNLGHIKKASTMVILG